MNELREELYETGENPKDNELSQLFFLLGQNSLHALTVHVSCDKICVLTGHCDIKLSTASIYKGSMRQRLCTHVIHSRNSALINRNKH